MDTAPGPEASSHLRPTVRAPGATGVTTAR